MQRISVDFNTLDSEPVDLVKLGQIGTPVGDALPPLHAGERVLLYDEEMAVEATVRYDDAHRFWLAAPDWTTRREVSPTGR